MNKIYLILKIVAMPILIICAFYILITENLTPYVLIITGAILNFLVMSTNKFKMPVKFPRGAQLSRKDLLHSKMDKRTKLPFLGDIFVTKRIRGWAGIFSIGDILIVMGVILSFLF